MSAFDRGERGFTLIELSIVLVVIGLIVGGVLVGQDLIRAAGTRATVSQIERYNTAVNTFREKYNALPGDVSAPSASQFGFIARAGGRGRGDGNGVIEGFNYPFNNVTPTVQGGETLFFWEDLATARLIESQFNSATDTSVTTTTDLTPYLPAAKLGGGNFIYVYSGGVCPTDGTIYNCNSINYFGLSAPVRLDGSNTTMTSKPGLTVSQAYAMDSKIDDGMPASGNVQANYVYGWSPGDDGVGFAPSASTDSATTCYDSASNLYSMNQNGGAGVNCALSFKIQ